MSDLTSIISAAVASSKETPNSDGAADAIEANGDVVGTADADTGEALDGVVEASGPEDDGTGDGVVADEPVVATAETPKVVEETDEFAKEHELKSKDSLGRENRIPYSRVKKITDNAVKKATATLQTEHDTVKAHNTEYVSRLERIKQVEDIMFNDPARMVGILRTLPGYEAALGTTAPAAKAAAAAPGDIDFAQAPGPDTDTGYSSAGLQKLLAWTVSQATDRATAAAEAKVAERYKPLEESFSANQRAEATQRQLSTKVTSALTDASSWKLFPENEAAILKALQDDSAAAAKPGGKMKYTGPTALRKAYEDVVFGSLTADRAKIHAEVVAGLKAAPRSTSAGAAGGVKAAADTGPLSTEDIIRASLNAARSR